MTEESRANFLEGTWRSARSGASFADRLASSGEPASSWPQSGPEDVSAARAAARAAGEAWRRMERGERGACLGAMARVLERDRLLLGRLGARFGVEGDELAAHLGGLGRGLEEHAPWRALVQEGVAWCAPDWRDLVRAPFFDLARQLLMGRTVVLVSDQRVPELGHHLARAAWEAELPSGVLGLLHGARRELLGLAFTEPKRSRGDVLVASGLAEHMPEYRRLAGRAEVEAYLRALRCGAHEIDPERGLEESALEVVERAFGKGATLGGQLPGALARVFCPQHVFSRFSELFLERLEASSAAREPVVLLDEDSRARVRAAWELGLDEGATCIAGGNEGKGLRAVPPTVFTNVEPHMACAKRQDPLPVLSLLRSS